MIIKIKYNAVLILPSNWLNSVPVPGNLPSGVIHYSIQQNVQDRKNNALNQYHNLSVTPHFRFSVVASPSLTKYRSNLDQR